MHYIPAHSTQDCFKRCHTKGTRSFCSTSLRRIKSPPKQLFQRGNLSSARTINLHTVSTFATFSILVICMCWLRRMSLISVPFLLLTQDTVKFVVSALLNLNRSATTRDEIMQLWSSVGLQTQVADKLQSLVERYVMEQCYSHQTLKGKTAKQQR